MQRTPSPSKKPPFIATSKSIETFSNVQSYKAIQSDINESRNTQTLFKKEPNCISPSHILIFQKQSVRWLNLSSVLFVLTVLDSNRIYIDKESYINFFQVLKWRANSTISDSEFSALYAEWISKGNNPSSKKSSKNSIGLFVVRQILLELNCLRESELDLYIGILVNEINRAIFGSPIASYRLTNTVFNTIATTSQIELCSDNWIKLSEELFFILDSPGYGMLSFDSVYFLSASLTMGLYDWNSKIQVEDDLSIGILSATSLQILRDVGCHILISVSSSNTKPMSSFHANKINPISTSVAFTKYSINLTMFKHYLIRKCMNEKALSILIKHVRLCIDTLKKFSVSNPVNSSNDLKFRDINVALHPIETVKSTGSPRLWQHAVLTALDYPYNHIRNSSLMNSMNTPPFITFLLSDAEKYLHGLFYAIEEDSAEGTNISLASLTDTNGSSSELNMRQELHKAALRMMYAFNKWASNAHNNPLRSVIASQQYDDNNISSDPIYKSICKVLVTYKEYQNSLSHAFIQISRLNIPANCNNKDSEDNNHQLPRRRLSSPEYLKKSDNEELVKICAMILPNIEPILIELGYGDETQNNLQFSPQFDQETDTIEETHTNVNGITTSGVENTVIPSSIKVSTEHKDTVPSTIRDMLSISPKVITLQSGQPDLIVNNDFKLKNSILSDFLNVYGNRVNKKINWGTVFDTRDNSHKEIPQYESNYNETGDNRFGNQTKETYALPKALSRQKQVYDSNYVISNNKTQPDYVNDGQKYKTPINRRVARSPERTQNDVSKVPVNYQSVNPKKSDHSTSNRRVDDDDRQVYSERENISNEKLLRLILNELLKTDDSNTVKHMQLIQAMKLLSQYMNRQDSTSSDEFHLFKLKILKLLNVNDSTELDERIESQRSRTHSLDSQNDDQFTEQINAANKLATIAIEISKQNESNQSSSQKKNLSPNVRTPDGLNPDSNPNSALQNKSKDSKIFNNDESNRKNDDDSIHLSDLSMNSNGPSSVAELFESGKQQGAFAQTFREILRRMSRDDSHVTIKSLEQILQLGNEIIEKENQEKALKSLNSNASSSGVGGKHLTPNNNISEDVRIRDLSKTSSYSPAQNNGPPKTFIRVKNVSPNRIINQSQNKISNRPSEQTLVAGSTSNDEFNKQRQSSRSNQVASKKQSNSIPGVIPSNNGKKTVRKVFGHPF